MKFFITSMLLFLVSCLSQDNLSPEGALQSFIEGRLGQVVTRDFILERVTGGMKESVEHMSDEDFVKFADMTSAKRDSFKILSKSCQDTRCFMTYSVSYKTLADDKATFSSEVKKIAELISVEGKWLIADVSNIKTYHESLAPISPLE